MSFLGDITIKWSCTIFSAVLVGITGVIPVLLIPLDKSQYLSTREGQNQMNYFLSFAVGSILGDVFLHLLPETWELYTKYPDVGKHQNIGILIILGIVIFLWIEKICISNNGSKEKSEETNSVQHSNNHISGEKRLNDSETDVRQRKNEDLSKNGDSHVTNDSKGKGDTSDTIKVEGYLNLLANVIDNFAHGLAVGGSYCVSPWIGFLSTVCILIHEIPHEVSDFVILLRAGFDKKRAVYAQLSTASSSLLGAVMALLVDSATAGLSKAYILPFTCGGFIYVSLVTLVPNLTKEEDPHESFKQFVLIIFGLVVTAMLACWTA